MVDDVAMVSNVPMDVRAGDVVVSGASVTLPFPAGKTVMCYELVITGNNGSNARFVLPATVTCIRQDDGTILGDINFEPGFPGTLPGWVTAPVADTGVNSVIVTLAPGGATWRTSVRAKALTNV